MILWIAVITASLLSLAIKFAGYLVPERILEVPWIDRVVPLLTVALLSSLVITQGFLDADGIPTIDARAGGIGVAIVLLMLRAPFIVVVAVAAVVAALIRAWT